MKKFFIILFILIITQNYSFCENFTSNNLKPYTENNKYYGLKDDKDNIIIEAKYKKIIRLGSNVWIIQNRRNKFGLIDNNDNILVEPRYTHAERYFNKYVKLGNYSDFGLYNENGQILIPTEYNAIMPLFGKKFLTYKNFKYGIFSNEGEMILDNIFEYIYMPNPKKICLKYNNQIFEVDNDETNTNLKTIQTEIDMQQANPNKDIPFIIKTGAGTGYSIVSATDYTIKAFSAVSNAYEETIDELMFSQGVDTVSLIFKMSWLPKFPVIFAKNYWNNLANPNKGPLSDVKADLKEQIK